MNRNRSISMADVLTIHGDYSLVKFSPCGQRLVTVTNKPPRTYTVKIWELPSGACLFEHSFADWIHGAAFSTSTNELAVGFENTLQLIDLLGNKVKKSIQIDENFNIHPIRYLNNDATLFLMLTYGYSWPPDVLMFIDRASGKAFKLSYPNSSAGGYTLSEKSHTVTMNHRGSVIRIVHYNTRKVIGADNFPMMNTGTPEIVSVDATLYFEPTVIRDFATHQLVWKAKNPFGLSGNNFAGPQSFVGRFSSDNRFFALAYNLGSAAAIKVWDIRSDELLYEQPLEQLKIEKGDDHHARNIISIAFLFNNLVLAVWYSSRKINFINISSGEICGIVKEHFSDLYSPENAPWLHFLDPNTCSDSEAVSSDSSKIAFVEYNRINVKEFQFATDATDSPIISAQNTNELSINNIADYGSRLQSTGRVCKKCGYERKATDDAPEYSCPRCGAVYTKVEAHLKRQEEKANKR